MIRKFISLVLFFIISAYFTIFKATATLAVTSIISNTSVSNAAGPSHLRHVVVTSDETVHAFLQLGTSTATCGSESKSGLLWFNSTDAGTTWTCQGQLSSDTTNAFYSSVVTDSSDNIYVVYSTTGSGANAAYDVYYRKLTKNAGANWTLEAEQKILDGTASDAYTYASIDLEGTTRIWLASRYYNGSNYLVQVYYSDGLGTSPTWTQSTANLDSSASGTNASGNVPAVIRFGSRIGVFYIDNSYNLYFKYRDDSQSLTVWQDKMATHESTINSHFSAVGTSNGDIYLAVSYSASANIDKFHNDHWFYTGLETSTFSEANTGIGVATDGNTAWIAHNNREGFSPGIANGADYLTKVLKTIEPQNRFNYEEEESLTGYYGSFDKYWSYVSGVYTNDTTDSSSSTAADTQMVSGVGDIAYFGKSGQFDAVAWDLSTNGTNGVIAWEYWNGSSWEALTFLSQTSSNASNFRGDGYGTFTIPGDWAATQINGEGTPYYYIRARVTTAFTTTPVGSQLQSMAPTPFMSMTKNPSSANKLYLV